MQNVKWEENTKRKMVKWEENKSIINENKHFFLD